MHRSLLVTKQKKTIETKELPSHGVRYFSNEIYFELSRGKILSDADFTETSECLRWTQAPANAIAVRKHAAQTPLLPLERPAQRRQPQRASAQRQAMQHRIPSVQQVPGQHHPNQPQQQPQQQALVR
jgi:hypothetical protein